MAATALQFEEQPFTYPEYTDANYGWVGAGNVEGGTYNPNSLANKITDAMGFSNHAQNYENYLADKNRAYEQHDAATARRFEEYMASTQYQRMVKDLEAAGLNPWLAVQNGVSGSAGSGSVGVHSSARQASKYHDSKASQLFSALAMFMLATAKMASMM